MAFHAHPDDEALLTGGVLARYAAQGHRVVLVVATDGGLGLAGDREGLGPRRLAELDRAAAALGVSRTVLLGYGDSGFEVPEAPPAGSFCAIPVAEAAERLAAVLVEEHADVLTIYDDNGGYGHRDHLRVREVGLAAAELAGTPRVLAATVEREALLRALRLLRLLGIKPGGDAADRLPMSFTPAAAITHEIDVRAWVPAKRRALRAHASQATGGDMRTVRLLGHLPGMVASRVLGREWFVEVGAAVPPCRVGDVFEPAAGSGTVEE